MRHGDKTAAFQEKYAKAVKVFKEYMEGARFVDRVNRDILCAMCELHGLDTSGYKVDLFLRLKKWVCPSQAKSFIRSVPFFT